MLNIPIVATQGYQTRVMQDNYIYDQQQRKQQMQTMRMNFR